MLTAIRRANPARSLTTAIVRAIGSNSSTSARRRLAHGQRCTLAAVQLHAALGAPPPGRGPIEDGAAVVALDH